MKNGLITGIWKHNVIERSVIETGRIEGREEGRAEGRAEGKVEGRVEGLKEASEKIARNLKQLAVPIEVITKSTG